MSTHLKAWTVELYKNTCVVFAPTRAKAQWIAINAYWDSYGREKGIWPGAKAYRAKPYDKSPLIGRMQKAWIEEYVIESMRAK